MLVRQLECVREEVRNDREQVWIQCLFYFGKNDEAEFQIKDAMV